MKEHKINAEEIGEVTVYMYKDIETNLPFFEVTPGNDEVEQVAYIIEDALYDF